MHNADGMFAQSANYCNVPPQAAAQGGGRLAESQPTYYAGTIGAERLVQGILTNICTPFSKTRLSAEHFAADSMGLCLLVATLLFLNVEPFEGKCRHENIVGHDDSRSF